MSIWISGVRIATSLSVPSRKPGGDAKIATVKGCTPCHDGAEYVSGGHDQAVLKGNRDAADCHGLHNTPFRREVRDRRRFHLRFTAYLNHSNHHDQARYPALQSNWLTVHVLTCFMGYGAFTIACGLGIMDMVNNRSGNGRERNGTRARFLPRKRRLISLPGLHSYIQS